MKSIIAFVVVLILFVGTMYTEITLEKDDDRYRCYRKREFNNMAEDYMCPGCDDSMCRRCQYRKNFLKEVNKRG